jgi:hypothetical protein
MCSSRRRTAVLMTVALMVFACASLWAQGAAARARGSTSSTVGTMASGMGGAFVAVAEDATALYWNPAGLARQDGFSWYTAVGGETRNLDVLDELEDVADIVSADEAITSDEFDLIRDVAQRNSGRPVSVGAGLFTGFTFGSFGLGAYGTVGADGQFAYTSGAAAAPYDERVDWMGTAFGQGGAGIGYGRRVSDRLDVGVTVKEAGVYRAEDAAGYAGYNAGEDEAEVSSVDVEGEGDTAFSLDLGVICHASDEQRWALVARNVTAPSFTLGSESLRLDPSFDVGWARHTPEGDIIAIDLHNVTEANDAKNDFAIGLQKRLAKGWDLRLGCSQQQPTYGMGIDLGFLNLGIVVGGHWQNRTVVSGALEF